MVSRNNVINMDVQEDTSLEASISHIRVLEQEYAYRHLPRERISQRFSPWDVLEGDIQDRDGLLRVLRDSGNPVSRHLRSLRELPVGNNTPELALYLTELIGTGTSLHEAPAFAAVSLRDTTQELLKVKKRERWFQIFQTQRFDASTREEDSLRLNRQLLEDAFPGQIRHFDACNRNLILHLIHEERPSALCFSGGGIRSASFCLGVLQGLARGRLVSRFDYLSTVSGGGYIGSWLSGWVKRHPDGLDGVEKELSDTAGASASVGSPARPLTVKTDAIGHLRSFCNYLTPQLGLLSADIWTLVAIFLRNLAIHWTIFLPFLAAFLALPRVCVSVVLLPRVHNLSAGPLSSHPEFQWLLGFLPYLCLLSGSWALCYIRTHLPSAKPKESSSQSDFLKHAILPLLILVISLTMFWSWNQQSSSPIRDVFTVLKYTWSLFAISAVCSFVQLSARKGRLYLLFLLEILPVGAASTLAGFVLFSIGTASFLNPVTQPIHFVCLASPLFGLAFLLISVVLVALVSRWTDDADREWLARAGGWIFILAVGWVALSSLVLFGPGWFIQSKQAFLTYAASSGGVLVLVHSLYAGYGSMTSAKPGTQSKGWSAMLLNITAPLSAAIVVVALSRLTSAGLNALNSLLTSWSVAQYHETQPSLLTWFKFALVSVSNGLGPGVSVSELAVRPGMHEASLYQTPLAQLVLCSLLVLGFGLLTDLLMNINNFSLHSLYRNRLIRAFLGASNPWREQDFFTGFSRTDDMALSDLTYSQNWSPPSTGQQRRKLFHVVNTALNLVAGKELAWQERKAEAFAMTPLHCGNRYQGYRPSNAYALEGRPGSQRPISLGTAVTISGAAVSPNMGYSSSTVVAFLLTLFNLRLGCWLGNPGRAGSRAYQRPAPPSALWHLTKEALGLTDDQAEYVYLSDGGHFENLALYAMVERRCHFIVVVDGGCDPHYTFEDLGNAIRKIRIDLGIPIEFQSLPICAGEENREGTGLYCAIGNIQYSCRDGEGVEDGTVVYLKPAVYGAEPVDVRHYKASHPAFPHESTADQWFGESQFESYRKLGEHIATTVFKILEVSPSTPLPGGNSGLVASLRQRWYPPSPCTEKAFTKHAETVEDVFEMIRSDANLRFMDAQIYPEWRVLVGDAINPNQSPVWLPHSTEEVRAGFYACNQMIQLMESVYLDLNLDAEFDHPDNRGWMNLFKHWSWSGMLRVTYGICAGTYGTRFQAFCKLRLGLEPFDEIELGPPLTAIPEGAIASDEVWEQWVEDSQFNFLEVNILKSLWKNGQLNNQDVILPLQVRLQSPQSSGQYVRYPFGLAILRPALFSIDKQLLGCNIRYFRIQDHLRHMGLGRNALARLLQDPELAILGTDLIDFSTLQFLIPDPVSTRARLRFEGLYASVLEEVRHPPAAGGQMRV